MTEEPHAVWDAGRIARELGAITGAAPALTGEALSHQLFNLCRRIAGEYEAKLFWERQRGDMLRAQARELTTELAIYRADPAPPSPPEES